MRFRNGGIAFLPGGCALPEGSYPVYPMIDVSDDGVVTGEVHFAGEPKYPRPISIGRDFDVYVAHPNSVLGDDVALTIRFVDDSGSVAGYVRGSPAQFRPQTRRRSSVREDSPLNPRDVFVIHGRDMRLRDGMFSFLRALGLNPMEWAHAVELAGKGSPYVGEVLDAAFTNAQAVVVLLTPDDVAMLRPELHGEKEPDHEVNLTPQARANVIFEAGMAMARHPSRTILVEIGRLRPFSDVGGRHTIRMDGSSQKRNDLASRLKIAGCPVNTGGADWLVAGDLRAPEIPHITELNPSLDSRESIDAPSPSHAARMLDDLISELEDNLSTARAQRAGDTELCPSNIAWRRQQNKLDIPASLRDAVAGIYGRIDRWLDIVASGLNPNIAKHGVTELDMVAASLSSQLPKVIATLKDIEFHRTHDISQDSRDLLLAAAEGEEGFIMLVEMNEGVIVQANGRQFAETGNRRSEARWKQAVGELISLHLIDRHAPDSEVLPLTHAGYDLADKLRPTDKAK